MEMNLCDNYLNGKELYDALSQPVCDKYGLTMAEYGVLMFLAYNPEHCTASDISRIRQTSKSYLSVSIHSLEEKGLITGEYRNGNRRSVYLTVTSSALPIIADGKKVQEKFNEILHKGFSDEEKKMMADFLVRLSENIAAAKISI